MVYFDQSYLPITFLSPLQLRFQSSSWYPSLSFYFYLFTKALFYFCLRVCIWLCESLGLGVVSAEARWGCWRPCCWSYRQLWAIQHGWGNWTSQIHQNILNHLGNSPAPFRYFFSPNNWMSSIRVSELLIGARVRVCLQCPGHFTSSCTNEENVSPLIKHHLLYESSGSGRFPPDSVTGCGRDQFCVDLMQVILTSVSSSVKTITDKNMWLRGQDSNPPPSSSIFVVILNSSHTFFNIFLSFEGIVYMKELLFPQQNKIIDFITIWTFWSSETDFIKNDKK